jgi:hypothetical protein
LLRQFRDFFVNRAHLHFTLRELRDSFQQPVTLAVLAGVAIVVGVSGPFDTIRAFELPARLAYWGVVVPLTYAAGLFGSAFVRPIFARHAQTRSAKIAQIAGLSLGSALAVSLILAGLNSLLGLAFDLQSWIMGFGAVYLICLTVEIVSEVIAAETRGKGSIGRLSPDKAPPILARLPLDKRGALVALSVQDHYVEVETTKGKTLILSRLSDAIGECAPIKGLQIHRSYWVAQDQVVSARRVGDGAVVVTATGLELPVARSRLGIVQAAGVLPRKG